MQIRYRTLTLLITLTLTGCNTLSVKTDPVAKKTLNQPVTPHTHGLTTTPLVSAETAPVARPTEATGPTPPPREPNSTLSAQPSSDLMDRLRAGFRLEIPDQPRIKSQIQWYATHSDYLNRVQQRATPYLHFILEEAEKRNIPTELVLLPIVESSFRPFAYSPGRAAGLWQFIPSTGKHFGLEQNWWYDGRRDVVAATRAALDYLSSMARQFDGNWELALAGYNAGAGTVQRAIRQNQKQGKPTDFWSLSLPSETRDYVPRLLAVAKIFSDPKAYGLSLSSIPNRPYFENIDVHSQLDLALAAEMANISIEQLYRLNPGFNRWATAPDGPHRLSIPVEKAPQFEQALAELDPEKRLHWNRYKIRPGDNLGTIARNHKTTVALLQRVNNLNGNRIRAGKHLLIPVAAKRLDKYTHSIEARLARTQNRSHKGTRLTHRVQSGDTLWDLARRYHVTYQALARWNGLSPRDPLRLGQPLVIWQQHRKPAQGKLLATAPINTLSSLNYRVRKGDSLALIAQRFNVTVSDLRKWNTLQGQYLQPGQQLQLFVDVTEQTL